jgi:hypothetical protein
VTLFNDTVQYVSEVVSGVKLLLFEMQIETRGAHFKTLSIIGKGKAKVKTSEEMAGWLNISPASAQHGGYS